jgi:hypothetical protein
MATPSPSLLRNWDASKYYSCEKNPINPGPMPNLLRHIMNSIRMARKWLDAGPHGIGRVGVVLLPTPGEGTAAIAL